MKRLNGMDAMLLYSETPNLHMHTLKVAVVRAADFQGDFTFAMFREILAGRLDLLDPLRYRLVDVPLRLHHPMWLENCDVDLDYHLRRVTVPAPGGRRELDQVIGEVASTPLDRTRPLWELYLAEGLQGDRFAVIGKVHHVLADGVASANLLARGMDVSSHRPSDLAHHGPSDTPSSQALLRAAAHDHVRQIAHLPGLVRDAVRGIDRVRRRSRERDDLPDMAKPLSAPTTFLNHVVSPNRTFASATLPLTEFKATAKKLGTTFNDTVLAMATGGLRELLLRYDGGADQPIVASVPVSTDRSPDRITGNELSGMSVSLPVHVEDPLERVRLISLSTSIAKENHELLGPHLYARIMAYLPSAIAPAAFRWQSARASGNRLMNVPVSNVAGPRERGRLGGAVVSEIYSTGVLSPGVGMNMTVWSYVDQVNIAVLSDDETFGDVHEATDAMIRAFTELRLAAGLSGDLPELADVMARATASI